MAVAQYSSPFAGMADDVAMPGSDNIGNSSSNLAGFLQAPERTSFDLALHQRAMTCNPGLARSSCMPAFGHSTSAKLPAAALDLDALMAAAACKPDYMAAQQQLKLQQQEAARAAAVARVLQDYSALPIASGCNAGIAEAALHAIGESGVSDTFYVYDLGEVARLHATWVATLPRVTPFYAVKCNPEPGMIAMLNALGAGFDCASVQELQRAAVHHVPQDRIIFANPCKRPGDFRYARENGVEYTTFDCVSELEKIAAGYPAFKCVLRIRCDDADAKINLGLKYGADLCDVPMLLETAKNLGLQVVGVSFHVGSGCQNVGVYADAISAAREAFDMASSFGFSMELLDIGGGFTAPYDEATASLFYRTAGVINRSLAHWFPPGCGVRVIAEPGRYFAETSATLFTTILGQRDSVCPSGQPFRDYWLSDGTYGSFRIQVAVDGLEPSYSVLRSPLLPPPTPEQASQLLPCRLWGNSDRDGDVVHKAALLPPLRDGDWLMFPYAGAYTICAASNYGGVRFTQPLKVFVFSSEAVREFGSYDVSVGAAEAAAAAAAVVAAAGVLPAAACCELLRAASTARAAAAQRAVSLPADGLLLGHTSLDQLLPCVQLLQGLKFSSNGRCCNSSGSTEDLNFADSRSGEGTDISSNGIEQECEGCFEYSALEVLQSPSASPGTCCPASNAAAAGVMPSDCDGLQARHHKSPGVLVQRMACSSGGGSSSSVLLMHGAGSDSLDCMSVASEGTAVTGVAGNDMMEFADVSSTACIE